MAKLSNNKAIFSQIETTYEALSMFAENGLETINVLVGSLDINELSEDERVALKDWHVAAQQSAKVIRETN